MDARRILLFYGKKEIKLSGIACMCTGRRIMNFVKEAVRKGWVSGALGVNI